MQCHLNFAVLLRLFVGYQNQFTRQPDSPECIAPYPYLPRHYYSQGHDYDVD